MLKRVATLLSMCEGEAAVVPPTTLFNEGWMLRLVLDWFHCHPGTTHELSFLPGARWYSEALLASRFLPQARRDRRAESFTHADGVVGHFDIRPGERGEATLKPGATQFLIVEAKLGSGLSSGVKNAPGYDQAARNAACIGHMLAVAGLEANSFDRLAFYVVAPQTQIDAGVFGDLVSESSVRSKVKARVAQYRGEHDSWYHTVFEPMLERLEIKNLSWETILGFIGMHEPESEEELTSFYEGCLRYNPLRAKPV